jgi:hypothetical protein
MKFESSSLEDEVTDDDVDLHYSKCKLANHMHEEKEGTARIILRYRTSCYQKSTEQKLREANRTTAKKKNLLF